MEYYERLKAAREDLDLTQTEVAEMIGTTQTQMYRYESGKQEITISKFIKLCKIYRVSADYILGLKKR